MPQINVIKLLTGSSACLLPATSFITFFCVHLCLVASMLSILMMLIVRWALYQGWWSLIVSISVNNFAYFYAFHSLRVFVISAHGDLSIHSDFLSGLVAGQHVFFVLFKPSFSLSTLL